MAGSLAYVDTSAYLKLLFTEHETRTLEAVVGEWPYLVSSELLEVEMHQAAYRAGLAAADCDDQPRLRSLASDSVRVVRCFSRG